MEPTSITTYAGSERMRYELPEAGISVTGYITRRLHKTAILSELKAQHSEVATLTRFAVFAVASATSWGPAYYQPKFDPAGTCIKEHDPETGACVTVCCTSREPTYRFEYTIEMADGATISGHETITGTKLSLRGLGMPAPSVYEYTHGDYTADAVGTIYTELAPRLLKPSRVRGYGALSLSDSRGQRGQVVLTRDGTVTVEIEQEQNDMIFQSLYRLC